MKVEYKAVGVGNVVKDAGDGRVSAFVMVTGLEDNVKDVIHPGAAAESLQKRTPKGVWSHDWTRPISRTESVMELPPGHPDLPAKLSNGEPWPQEAGAYKVDTLFNLATPEGNRAYQDVLFFGDQQEWSIGYKVPNDGYTIDKKSGVRHIHKLDWFEYSPVLFGAMSHARTKIDQPPSVAQAQLAHKALDGFDVSALLDEIKAFERDMNLTPIEYKGGDNFEGDGPSDVETIDAVEEFNELVEAMAEIQDDDEDLGDEGFDEDDEEDEFKNYSEDEDDDEDDEDYEDEDEDDEEETKDDLLGLIRTTVADLENIEMKLADLDDDEEDDEDDEDPEYDDFDDLDDEDDEDDEDYEDADEDEDEEEIKLMSVGATAYWEAKAIKYDNVTEAIEAIDVPLTRNDAQALVAAAEAFDDAIQSENKAAAEQAATEIMDILEVVVKSYEGSSPAAATVARVISDHLHRLEDQAGNYTDSENGRKFIDDTGVEYKNLGHASRVFGVPVGMRGIVPTGEIRGDEGVRAFIGSLDAEPLVGLGMYLETIDDDEMKEMVVDEFEQREYEDDDDELKGMLRRARGMMRRAVRRGGGSGSDRTPHDRTPQRMRRRRKSRSSRPVSTLPSSRDMHRARRGHGLSRDDTPDSNLRRKMLTDTYFDEVEEKRIVRVDSPFWRARGYRVGDTIGKPSGKQPGAKKPPAKSTGVQSTRGGGWTKTRDGIKSKFGVVKIVDDGRGKPFVADPHPRTGNKRRFATAEEAQEWLARTYDQDRAAQERLREWTQRGGSRRRTTEGESKSYSGDTEDKRDFSQEKRDKYAKSGIALKDGSFPIPDVDALKRAIKACGRAHDKGQAKEHIMARAKALGREDLIPEGWMESKELIDLTEIKAIEDAMAEFKVETN